MKRRKKKPERAKEKKVTACCEEQTVAPSAVLGTWLSNSEFGLPPLFGKEDTE